MRIKPYSGTKCARALLHAPYKAPEDCSAPCSGAERGAFTALRAWGVGALVWRERWAEHRAGCRVQHAGAGCRVRACVPSEVETLGTLFFPSRAPPPMPPPIRRWSPRRESPAQPHPHLRSNTCLSTRTPNQDTRSQTLSHHRAELCRGPLSH